MSNTDRYIPIDWYEKTGRASRYRDSETGEELTLYAYRKRIADLDDVEDLESDTGPTIAEAVPPPPPRRAKTDEQIAEESQGTGHKTTAGLIESLAPGLAAFVYTLGNLWFRHSARRALIPPPEVSTPILRPLSRIGDRHLKLAFALENTADGRDIIEMLGAVAGAGAWFMQALEDYDAERDARAQEGGIDYDAYERYETETPQPRTPPAPRATSASNGANGRGGREDAGMAPVDTGGWARELVRRTGEPHPEIDSQGGDNASRPASGPSNSQQYGEIATNRAAAAVRQLYALDSIGRRQRGLR
jgi:hypothetical protein